MYVNYLEALTTYKYLFWIYSGAITTKIKLSRADHVSAIGKNPGKMAVLYPIFTFLVFLKNYVTFRNQSSPDVESTVIKAYSCKISWR